MPSYTAKAHASRRGPLDFLDRFRAKEHELLNIVSEARSLGLPSNRGREARRVLVEIEALLAEAAGIPATEAEADRKGYGLP